MDALCRWLAVLLLIIIVCAALSANAFEWQEDGGLNLTKADVRELQAEIAQMQAVIEAQRVRLTKGGCV